MRIQVHLVAIVGLALALAAARSATAVDQSESFTYQGQLTELGQPANGVYDFEFRLYDAAQDGTPLGLNDRPDLPVSDGIFSTTLSFFSQVTGQQRWLEIRVRPGDSEGEYTMLAPRQMITSTPYAVYALRVAPHDHAGSDIGTTANASGTDGVGLRAVASATGGANRGVIGEARGITGWGVHGVAHATDGSTRGVFGLSYAPNGRGVLGTNAASSGAAIGVQGATSSPDGIGVSGRASSGSPGAATGVLGSSDPPGGTGVKGVSGSNGGRGAGVFGETLSGDGPDPADWGNTQVAGVLGVASSTAGTSRHGVVGITQSATGAGVYASNLGAPSTGPDLILGASDFGDGGDNGILSSVPDDPNSDLFINAMDTVAIRLNHDGSTDAQSTTSRFEISYRDGTGTANRIFLVEHDGDVYADRAFHCGQSIDDGAGDLSEAELAPCLVDDSPADFAEMLPSDGSPRAGDVLAVDPDGNVTVSRSAYAGNLIGVRSTRPSYLGNAAQAEAPGYVPLAVSGIVPVNATSENGAVRPGDLLTSSSVPGHAMRCEGVERCFGRVVGKALDALPDGRGQIRMLVSLQ